MLDQLTDNNVEAAVSGETTQDTSVENTTSETMVESAWFDDHPEDYKGFTSKYSSPEEAFRGAANLAKKVGQKTDPAELLKDEAFTSALREAQGVPTEATAYTIEGVEISPDMQQALLTAGVSVDNFKQLHAAMGKSVEQFQGTQQAKVAEHNETVNAHYEKNWGDEFDSNIAFAKKGAKQHGFSTEFLGELENNPNVSPEDRIKLIDLFVLEGKRSGEGGVPSTSAGVPGPVDLSGLDAAKIENEISTLASTLASMKKDDDAYEANYKRYSALIQERNTRNYKIARGEV